MLRRWTLENFKPIRARIDLPVAPLTVLAGLNSSGKSSFLQSILLVAQTLSNQRLDEPLVLNGPSVRLGTFQDVCNERAGERRIRIGFELDGPGETEPPSHDSEGISIQIRAKGSGWLMSLDAGFEGVAATGDEAAGIQATRAVIEDVRMDIWPAANGARNGSPIATVTARKANPEQEDAFLASVSALLGRPASSPYPRGQNYLAAVEGASQATGTMTALVRWAHFVPAIYALRGAGPLADEKTFLSVADAAEQIISTFTSAIRYLGPLRADPQFIQSFSPSGQPDDVGPRGEYAASVYAANRKQILRFFDPTSQKVRSASLEEAMDLWLRHLGVADHVSAREAAAPGVSWMVRSAPANRERPLGAVGVGVSQVLPILVAGLLSPDGAILVIEQPELHLHERPQARLGDFFYGLTRVGKQVFVETHSAVLIGQLRYRMVKSGQEARDAIAIYFVSQDEHGDAKFEPIRISKRGAVENWPDGFFDESFRQEDLITEEGIRAGGSKQGHA